MILMLLYDSRQILMYNYNYCVMTSLTCSSLLVGLANILLLYRLIDGDETGSLL